MAAIYQLGTRQPARRGAAERLRVAVLGYIVRCPMGGMSWQNLNYLAGLAAMGHEVAFIEIGDQEPTCYDPRSHQISHDASYGLEYATGLLARLGFAERWAFYDSFAKEWRGPLAGRAPGFCASADVVLNISGVNPLEPWFETTPHRVLIDTDPAFTQIKHLTDTASSDAANAHTAFFTFGENIPLGNTDVPDDGLPWQATRQPMVSQLWPVMPAPRDGKYTTVMQWDSYSVREFAGRAYGMKSKSFWEYADLPLATGPIFDIALGGRDLPYAALEPKGWRFSAPLEVAPDAWTYRAFIQGSKAEFGLAKHGYVMSRSGWFSERSACYLATGRPVIAHDTGFGAWLPTGRGVLKFSNLEEARAAIETVNSAYPAHCRAAIEIAEAYFAADRVLGSLLERTFASTPARAATSS